MSGRFLTIRVAFGRRSGTLMFEQGRLVHASTGKLTGEEAFFEMACWSGGTFEEVPKAAGRPPVPNVKLPLSQLMIEAARRRDEEERKEFSSQSSGGGSFRGPN
jgi:hypothetical protein